MKAKADISDSAESLEKSFIGAIMGIELRMSTLNGAGGNPRLVSAPLVIEKGQQKRLRGKPLRHGEFAPVPRVRPARFDVIKFHCQYPNPFLIKCKL